VPKEEIWRKLAAEALVAASNSNDPQAKKSLVAIALAYQKLADRAGQQKDDPDKK
jgi:hypothetical protein